MNIAPALPSPQQWPAPQERTAVGAVRPSTPARDAVDEQRRREAPAPSPDRAGRGQSGAHLDAVVSRQGGYPSRVGRALASYAEVAADGQRSELRAMLGFDAYA